MSSIVENSAGSANSKDGFILAHAGLVQALAAALARRLPPCFEEEDLRQVGFVALLRVADRAAAMDESHRLAYLKCRVRGAMLDAVKRGAYREATHQALLPDADAVAAGPSPEDMAARAQIAAVVEAARAQLSERQRDVLRFRYGAGLTQRETGEAMGGLRQPTVMARERRAVAALRAAIARPGPRKTAAHRAPLRPPLAA